jgi:hypothetical protein
MAACDTKQLSSREDISGDTMAISVFQSSFLRTSATEILLMVFTGQDECLTKISFQNEFSR